MSTTATDTVLGHCLMRAALQNVKGDSRLASTYAVVRATPKASRVAAFIALWATALLDLDVETLGPEAYARWASESNRTVYRRLADFRELWPEYELPNELASLLAAEARRTGSRPSPSASIAVAA